jgi:uncharacterized protein
MKKRGNGYALSASDLVGFLNCQYLTDLDRAVADGMRPKPASWSPALEALRERGAIHEGQFVAHLREPGHDVVVIDGVDVSPPAITQTIAAMRVGRSIIVQGALAHEGWGGRIDVLRRVDTPSTLGPWSYEVTDTKLARETKAGTVLQLCLYSDLVAWVQKIDPEHMDVVSPWTDFKPQRYSYHDYAAFYRKARSALAACVATPGTATYPEPKTHCEVCRWAPACDKRQRDDDHLCLVAGVTADAKATVQSYNRDDCLSAERLRAWLEMLRQGLVDAGSPIARPAPEDGTAPEKVSDWTIKIKALVARLTADMPADAAAKTCEQQARWVLAHILDWHRREKKATWWERFRLSALSADELVDERAGFVGLEFLAVVGGTGKAPIHRYSFSQQDTDIREGDKLRSVGGRKYGEVHSMSAEGRTVDIKKRQDTAGDHAEAVFGDDEVGDEVCAEALVRIGEYVAAHGMEGSGTHEAARALLMRTPPAAAGGPLRREGESTLDAAVRLAGELSYGVLPVQGPPGAGKTYTGAQMIFALVRSGKKVGITANSHKVIRNMIDGVLDTAKDQGLEVRCCHKTDDNDEPREGLTFAKKSERLLQGMGTDWQVGGGTAWLWSRSDALGAVDVLFVDEAAQMSLANVLAASHAAPLLVLLGDPQQLDQPTQGTHPDGTGVSALHHILDGEQTISPGRGLFLEETWRLHPAICAFTSELFYAGKLGSKDGLDKQVVRSGGAIGGAGLRLLSVPHAGNQNSSPEEAEAIEKVVKGILASQASWTDRKSKTAVIGLDDILIITPYNAQVFEIQRRLPGARVGTVDKFQGQEAPIAIYSMATSSHADAPRGMEFLYSLNRLNVATSRAKCLSILVASPQVFEVDCRSPRQIQLANAFCRFVEMAEEIAGS